LKSGISIRAVSAMSWQLCNCRVYLFYPLYCKCRC